MLQRLGRQMKEAYGKDSAAMQDALPNALKKYELHKIAFFPISNPRYGNRALNIGIGP